MGSSSTVTKNDKISYANIIRESVKKKNCELSKEDMHKLEMKKNKEVDRAWKQSSTTYNDDFRRYALARRPPIPMYPFFFFGLCYSCNNYGHNAIDCRAYARNRNTWSINSYENSRSQFDGNYVRKPRGAFDKNYNRFGALNYEIECYKCNNFGHTTINCRSRFTCSSSPSKENRQVPKQQTIWKNKQDDFQIEECGIALTT
jgi:hypothetical protein